MTTDGKLDLLIPEPFSDHTVVNRGALYIIKNTLLHSYLKKDVSLDDPINFSLRIDGPTVPYAMFSSGGVTTGELYTPGKKGRPGVGPWPRAPVAPTNTERCGSFPIL